MIFSVISRYFTPRFEGWFVVFGLLILGRRLQEVIKSGCDLYSI